MIRVLLADDQRLVREGWRVLLDLSSGISIVGEAKDGQEAIELAQQLQPDVILMDVNMPRRDGLQATRQIVERQQRTKILMVTQSLDETLVRSAMQHGACGYLSKNDAFDELLPAIFGVQAGGPYFSKTIREQWPHFVSGHLARVGGGQRTPRDPSATYRFRRLERAMAEAPSIIDSAKAVCQQSRCLVAQIRQTRALTRQLLLIRHPDASATK